MTEQEPRRYTSSSQLFPTSISIVRLMALAITFLEKGARTSTVEAITGLSKKEILQIYRGLKDNRPLKGLIPRDAEWPAKTPTNNMHTALLLQIYAEINTKCHNPPNKAEVFSASYSAYEKTVDLTLININRAWRIVQQFTDGEIQMRQCPHCRISYVLIKSMPKQYHCCPHCDTASRLAQSHDSNPLWLALVLANSRRRLTSTD